MEDLCHRHAKMEGVSVLDKYTETHKEQDVSSSMIYTLLAAWDAQKRHREAVLCPWIVLHARHTQLCCLCSLLLMLSMLDQCPVLPCLFLNTLSVYNTCCVMCTVCWMSVDGVSLVYK